MKTLITLTALVAAWEAFGWIARSRMRAVLFGQAQAAAQRRVKPLLVIGCPAGLGTGLPMHPCGDVLLDTQACPACPGSVSGSVEDLSAFTDGQFGAVFVGHVLEEVSQPDLAWTELNRVADEVFVAAVPPWSLAAWALPDSRNVILGADPAGLHYVRI